MLPLAQAGPRTDRLIHFEAGDETALLACCEHGPRHGGAGTVLAETAQLSMTASAGDGKPEHDGHSGAPLAAADGGGRSGQQTRQPQTLARLDGALRAALGAGLPRARWLVEPIRCRAGESTDFEVQA